LPAEQSPLNKHTRPRFFNLWLSRSFFTIRFSGNGADRFIGESQSHPNCGILDKSCEFGYIETVVEVTIVSAKKHSLRVNKG